MYSQGVADYAVETIKADGLVANGPDDTVGNFDLDRVNDLIEKAIPVYTALGSAAEGRPHRRGHRDQRVHRPVDRSCDSCPTERRVAVVRRASASAGALRTSIQRRESEHHLQQHVGAGVDVVGPVYSAMLCDSPLTLGTKTIAVGHTRASICASWPAPDGIRLVE